MKSKNIVMTTAVSLFSGYVATKIMEKVSKKLYELETEQDRKQEDKVRPGSPFEIAAQKSASLLDIKLNEQQVKKAGLAFHYGLGMGWAPLYALLKHNTNLSPVLNGLITGAALSLIVDEGLIPALGFSAPNRDYPLVTHYGVLLPI